MNQTMDETIKTSTQPSMPTAAVPVSFQSRNPRFPRKPEKEVRSKPRIVKDNQIWVRKDNKLSIKIVEQTRYYKGKAFFNIIELDSSGKFLYDFIDEMTEEQIVAGYRLQRNYDRR